MKKLIAKNILQWTMIVILILACLALGFVAGKAELEFRATEQDKQARTEEAVMMSQYDAMTDDMRIAGVVLEK